MTSTNNYVKNSSTFNLPEEGGIFLGQTLDVFRRKLPIIIASIVSCSFLAVAKNQLEPTVFVSNFELLTEPVTIETKVISRTNPESLSSSEDIVAVEVDEIKLKILESRKIILPILEKLQEKYPNLTYDSLVESLQVTTTLQPNQSGNILTVSYASSSEEETKDVVNLVSQAYLNYSLESRQTDISQGITFLDAQIPELRARVNYLQKELEEIRQNYTFIDPIEEATLLSNQINTFSEQCETARAALKEAQLKYNALQTEKAEALLNQDAVASIVENPTYQELKTQILAIDLEIAKQSALLTENSSEMKILVEKKNNLTNLLKQEITRIYTEKENALKKEIQDLTIREQALSQTLGRLQAQIKLLSTLTRQYNDIQRELEIASTNYTQFITKREALKIDAAQKQVPWEILAPPSEPYPLPNSPLKSIVLGGMLGSILGLGAALLTDKISDKLYTSKELENITDIPILGEIPYEKNLKKFNLNLNIRDFPPYISDISGWNEAFNSLFNNLYFANKSVYQVRSLAISSPELEEGKSTVAFHLALTAANIGKRVLIVDANLRYPYWHKQLNLNNDLGFTNLVIAPDDIEIEKVIHSSFLSPNLYILTAGDVPRDTMTILGSERMSIVMKNLENFFDLVIYDTSKVLDLADAHLITSHTNGLLLVVGLGKVKAEVLKESLMQVKLAKTQILGIVTNELSLKKST